MPATPPPEPAPPAAGPRALRVLLVEDSSDDAALILQQLRRGGFEPVWERVESAPAMQAALARGPWDLVLADYSLPHFGAPAALEVLHASGLDLPFVIVSGQVGEAAAVAAMKAGAHDYIMKHELARLVPAIEHELREAVVRRERQRAQAAQQEEAEISAALVWVGREMISSLDMPVLLDRLCQLTAEVAGCNASHTFLRRGGEDIFVGAASYGFSPEEWEPMRVLRVPHAMLAGLISRLHREEVVPLDLQRFPGFALAQLSRQYGIRHVITVGLRRGNEIVGIHTAAHRHGNEPFSTKQRRLVQGIAQFASLALDHARLVEEAERASRLKSDFLATMSHELRTPLNVILGYLDLLLEGEFGGLTAAEGDTLRRIETSARELLDLINATLNLGRLEGGRVTLELGEVDLAGLLAEVESETIHLRDPAGVHFTCAVPADLPRLYTDAIKLKVVLKNVVSNALKFTAHGSVTVAAQVRNNGVEIEVTDTGIGIPAEAMDIIFEPFRQVDSSDTRRFGGVGLGLYIVRRLLDLLGGTVAAESRVDHGSTFRVWVPLHASPLPVP